MRAGIRGGAVVTCHPDHVRSIFTAKPEHVPSLDGRVAAAADRRTQLGADRQRPEPTCASASSCCRRFTARRSSNTRAMIERAIEAEIDRWPLNTPFPLAPRMQAMTLQVIMSGIFGVEGDPPPGSAERAPRVGRSNSSPPRRPHRWRRSASSLNHGRTEPVGLDAPRRRDARPRRLPRDPGAPPVATTSRSGGHPLDPARHHRRGRTSRSPTKSSATSC